MGNVFALEREILTDISTAGVLLSPMGDKICDILEDRDRDLNMDGLLEEGKVYGDTAIPYGFYPIVMQHSPHFKKMMPYLKDVKTHEGVMFHVGNKVSDSLGCLLAGKRVDEFSVSDSVKTFNNVLLPILAKYFAEEKELFLQVLKSRNVVDKRSKQ
jgi:hypothetical protein